MNISKLKLILLFTGIVALAGCSKEEEFVIPDTLEGTEWGGQNRIELVFGSTTCAMTQYDEERSAVIETTVFYYEYIKPKLTLTDKMDPENIWYGTIVTVPNTCNTIEFRYPDGTIRTIVPSNKQASWPFLK